MVSFIESKKSEWQTAIFRRYQHRNGQYVRFFESQKQTRREFLFFTNRRLFLQQLINHITNTQL